MGFCVFGDNEIDAKVSLSSSGLSIRGESCAMVCETASPRSEGKVIKHLNKVLIDAPVRFRQVVP